ncbi:Dbl homology domain-containing protein, partial [Absidia repens]
IELYQGVYTPLTRCYASRCPGDQTCYSHSCPRKFVSDTKRDTFQPATVTPNISNAPIPSSPSLPAASTLTPPPLPPPLTIKTNTTSTRQQQHSLWIHSVPRTIVCTTSLAERHRQEALYELIQTEIDFVGHLRYIKKCWIEPLSLQPQNESIVKHVFWNWLDILHVSTRLMEALVTRQQEDHRIRHVGGVLLAHVGQFEPFIIYGSHQMVGKFYLELEKKRNPRFAQFVKETEQRPESERLELNGYLTKVTTRLGRYPILLNTILKWTPAGHPDHELLGRVLEILEGLLLRLDGQVGQATHQFELEQISDRLLFNKFSAQQSLVKTRIIEGGGFSFFPSLEAHVINHLLYILHITYI